MTQAVDAPVNTAAHEEMLRIQAVEQIELALFWAKEQRDDLAIVFTNMAKLLLLEGNGRGLECEFWLLTTRAQIAEVLSRPAFAVECASKALELAEKIFADTSMLGYARGNLGKAVAQLGRHEEARKLLSQGIFALSAVSFKPPENSPEKLQAKWRQAFIEYARALQELPPRPRT